jgi:hypothetical protein
MSALGAGVGKAVGGLGGPQVAALVIAGGLVVGAIGGGIFAGGGSSQGATSAATLSIYPCPEAGPALATVPSGQQFLVTGKNAEATWVRIYYPLPGRTEAWVTAGPLKFDGSLGSLLVVPCSPVEAGPGASVGPGASLTALQDNSPSPPPPTVGPTTSPDGGPTLARLDFGTTIAGGPQRYCQRTPRSVTISVRATDRTGIASVSLSYRKPGAADYATKPMSKVGASDTWRATLATDPDGIAGPGSLRFFVTATDADAAPHTSRLPARSIGVVDCANEGPVLASLRAAPASVFTNTGACQKSAKTTAITVDATDVDDVAGVTLHYRLPGDGSFRDAKMTNNGDRWRATVTPVDQRPNADGKASYYVVGEDELGKSSRSPTRTFTVDRCNYPSSFGVVNWDTNQVCASATTVFASIGRATDQDGLVAQSAKVVYGFTPKGGGRKSATRSLTQTQVIGDNHYYSGQVNLKDLEPGSTVSLYVQLTDKYGDTTKDRSPNDTFSFQVTAGC